MVTIRSLYSYSMCFMTLLAIFSALFWLLFSISCVVINFALVK